METGQIEDISLQMQDITLGDQEKQIARVDRNKGQEWKQRYVIRKSDTEINPCAYCGMKKMHRDRRSCPAYGKTCDICQKQIILHQFVEQTDLGMQKARISMIQKEEEIG